MTDERTVTYELAKQIERSTNVVPQYDYKDEPTVKMMMVNASKHSDKGVGKPDLCLRVDDMLIVIEIKHGFDKHVEGGSNPASRSLCLDLSPNKIASKAENGALNYMIGSVRNNIDFTSRGIKHVFFFGISLNDHMDLIGRPYIISQSEGYHVRMPSFHSASDYFIVDNLRKVTAKADRLNGLGYFPMDEEIEGLRDGFRKLTRKSIDQYPTEIGLLLTLKLDGMFNTRSETDYDGWDATLGSCMANLGFCIGFKENILSVMDDLRSRRRMPKKIPFKKLSLLIDESLLIPEVAYGRFWAEMFHRTSLEVARIIGALLSGDVKDRIYDTSYGQCIASSRFTHSLYEGQCQSIGERLVVMNRDDDPYLLDKIVSLMLFGMESINFVNNIAQQRNKADILIYDQTECPSTEEQMDGILGSVRCLKDEGTAAFALSCECVESVTFTEQRKQLDSGLKLGTVVKADGYFVLLFMRERNRSGSKKVRIADVSKKHGIKATMDVLKNPSSGEWYECTLPDGKWFANKPSQSRTTSKTTAGKTGTIAKKAPAKKPSATTKKTSGTAKTSSTARKTTGTTKKATTSTRKTSTSTKKTTTTTSKSASTTKKTPTKKPSSTGRKTSMAKTAGTTKKATTSTRKTSTSTKNTKAGKTTTRK